MENKKILIANWKMNPSSPQEAKRLLKDLLSAVSGLNLKNIELVIAPPFVYLDLVKQALPKEIKLGSQNVFWAERGAYTGEISGLMLKNLGCDYVIIGHSERRFLGETDEMINSKIKAALRVGLKPVLAIGERNQNDDIAEVFSNQIKGALNGLGAAEVGRLIIAYEPVWAIGTGNSDTPDHALSAALLIRKIIGQMYSPDWAHDLPVIYGGSVSMRNARDFISQSGINGALVGGASLEILNFIQIIRDVSE